MATETLETAEPEGAAAPAQDKEELCSEAPRPAKGGKTEHKREDDEENNDVEVAGGEEEIVARGDDEEEGADEKATADESHDDDSKGRSKKKKKRSRAVKKSSDEADGKKDPVTPNSERPTRERKSVERYSAPLSRTPSGKGLLIEKGRGTQLKDIPNVAFKLSKRKADENLQILHTILFGKKAKVHSLKRNIGQFSGYVWVENEQEKQRAKVKEKLDKCVKDRLIDFCDMLNIPINKAIAKKEELLVKLLEFLESPHSTTDVLLAEKGQKRKRKVTGNKPVVSGEASSMTSEKKKQTPDVSKKQKISSQIAEKEEVDDKDENNGMKDDPDAASDDNLVSKEESADEKSKSEEEDDTPKETVSKSSSKRKAKEISVVKTKDALESGKKISSAKSSKKSSALASKKSAVDERDHKTPRSKSEGSVSKKQKVEKSKQKDQTVNPNVKTSSKKESKSSAKISIKEQGKGKSGKKSKGEPSREEMHAVVVDILKKVDFNTATLSDILRQLGTHFDVDLMHRKAEVKDIITEVINNMTDEDDDDDDDEEAEENAEVDGE